MGWAAQARLTELARPLLPASLVRQEFRLLRSDSPPNALDAAFGALRGCNAISAWLRINNHLQDLHDRSEDVIKGACAIADVLREQRGHPPSSCESHVTDELDAIAAFARSRMEAAAASPRA